MVATATTTSPSSHHSAQPFWAMLAASFVSRMGNSFSTLAIPWFVLATTNSPARAGIVAAAGLIPIAIAGVAGGVLVDRFGDRRMAIVSDLASAAPTAAIPLLYATVGLPFVVLVVLVVLGALLDTPGNAARSSLQPDLAIAAGLQLERANAWEAITRRMATLIGAPLSGLLIAAVGASNVLWINAASFVVSAAIMLLFVPRTIGRVIEHRSAHTNERGLRAALGGLSFVARDPLLRGIVIIMAAGGMLAEPVYAVILPVFAREVYGSALDLGILFAALAGGSILGAAAVAWKGQFLPRRTMLLTSYTVRALTFWVLLLQPHLFVVAAAIVINATLFEPSNPMVTTLMQERIPVALRGRVFGAVASLAVIAMPVGMVFYGWVLSTFGLMSGLWILASVNLLVPLGILIAPAFRHLDTHAPVPTGRPVTPATT